MAAPLIRSYERTRTSVLSYKVDLAPFTNGREGSVSDYLPPGVTISSMTVASSSDDVVIDSSTLADGNTSMIATISGGVGVPMAAAYITFHAVLSDAEEDDFTIKLVEVVYKSL